MSGERGTQESPAANDRVCIVGQSGTGKTVLARRLIAPLSRVIAIDSKRISLASPDWNMEDFAPAPASSRLAHRLAWRYKWGGQLRRIEEGGAFRYRIVPPLVPPPGYYEGIFRWIFTLPPPITLYIDELPRVLPAPGQFGPYLQALYGTGRELGYGVYSAMQRPSWVPSFALSESNFIYQFFLILPNDRKKMVEIVGEPPILYKDWTEHGFLMYTSSNRRHGPDYFPGGVRDVRK